MIGPLSSQLNAIKWGEFRLGDLFEVLSSKKIYHANTIKIHDTQIENSYPYVVRATTNNGIKGFIIDNPTFTNEKNTLSFAQDTFTVFYQKQPYFTGNRVKILKPKFAFKSPKILHFISAILQFILKPLTWGLGSTTESIAEFKFSLPLKPTANAQTLDDIDFDFMEKFIAELEQCRLAELEAYLKATGLENTTLSNDEENALNVFNGNTESKSGLTWQSFRLGDLFEIYTRRDIIIGQTQQGDIPLVSHQHENNGITKTIKEIHNRTIFNYKQTIALADRGVFLATTQNKDFHIGTRVKALVFKNGEQDKKTRLFFTTCINKNQIMFLDYSSNATNKLPNLTISLPTTKNGKIDFHFMRTLINALMKQTIQGVAQYCGAKIQATKEVINQETPVQKDSLF
ncbi:restriction endonuclease subunit S [Helicobacter pylori]|uniref:restriction endonuclease subunit S n=1 Tax=Helicobacter pylori TaxID=210 RepID=UPI000FDF48DA|nr:restriction endonuclease subunit S [Helicobacter pylori]RVY79954.1 restriction endonuclease subunit S [Helicobacter pylori]